MLDANQAADRPLPISACVRGESVVSLRVQYPSLVKVDMR